MLKITQNIVIQFKIQKKLRACNQMSDYRFTMCQTTSVRHSLRVSIRPPPA